MCVYKMYTSTFYIYAEEDTLYTLNYIYIEAKKKPALPIGIKFK